MIGNTQASCLRKKWPGEKNFLWEGMSLLATNCLHEKKGNDEYPVYSRPLPSSVRSKCRDQYQRDNRETNDETKPFITHYPR